MKLPPIEIADWDDVGKIGRGLVILALAAGAVIAAAAVLGLAWTVLKVAGSL